MNIPLGYEIGTGERVDIPLGHTIVLGQTQLSGKTTTLQAMTERSGVCAIAFITKRGEKSFRAARPIAPYFTETSEMQPYWKFVISMIEGVQDTKLGFRERGWVMQLCRDYEMSKSDTDAKGKKKRKSCEWTEPSTLRDVLENAKKALDFTKGVNELICLQLVEFLKMAVPEIESAKLSSTIELKPGINVMDISKLSTNVQSLVMRSVIEWVYLKRRKTVVIIPEAWKFLPEGRNTPVSFPVEELIRQGAALQNFVWIDLQDLRGIKKLLLRSIQVWLFGVQREKNEVANTLKSMPTPEHKPSASEMMQLGIGQFIAAYGNELRRVYVRPAGMEEAHAQAIAMGHEDPKSWKRIARALDEEAGSGAGSKSVDSDDQSVESSGLDRRVSSGDDPAGESGGKGSGEGSPAAESEDETMWKEKYEALEAEHLDLKRDFKMLEESHDVMAERLRKLEKDSATPTLRGPADKAGAEPQQAAPVATSNGHFSLSQIYLHVKDAASNDPGILQLLAQRPELRIKVERPIIEADGGTVRGRLALLLSKKFFDTPKNGNTAFNELVRLGVKCAKPNVYRELDNLAELGFVTKEQTGYQSVPGMKVNIVEAK